MAVFASATPVGFIASSAAVVAGGTVIDTSPSITLQPSDLVINEGGSLIFVSGYTGGNPPISTYWEVDDNTPGDNWTTVPGSGDTSSLSESNVQASADGNRYRFVVVDADNDTVYSDPALLTVNVPSWTTEILRLGSGGFVTRSQFRDSGG